MRIIAGSLKGRVIQAQTGLTTRPTSERVREALFSILYHRLKDAVVLDLFAGSGALAIEALSRGAREAVLVERDTRALAVLRRNIDALGLAASVRLFAGDYRQALERLRERRFTLAFLDPPYQTGLLEQALTQTLPLMEPGGLVICEQDGQDEVVIPDGLGCIADQRTYGRTRLTFVERIG